MPTLTRPPRRVVESTILAQVRAWAATQPDLHLWRNNTGALRDATGRMVRYGLCEGSADLVGLLTVDVGTDVPCPSHPDLDYVAPAVRRIARFLALEVKRPGEKPRPEQAAWLRVVQQAGGVAAVVTNVAEAERVIEEARRWER
jgi:hypothetical protein